MRGNLHKLFSYTKIETIFNSSLNNNEQIWPPSAYASRNELFVRVACMMGVDRGNPMNRRETGAQLTPIKERNGHGTHIFFDVKIREGGGVLIGIMALLGVGDRVGKGGIKTILQSNKIISFPELRGSLRRSLSQFYNTDKATRGEYQARRRWLIPCGSTVTTNFQVLNLIRLSQRLYIQFKRLLRRLAILIPTPQLTP